MHGDGISIFSLVYECTDRAKLNIIMCALKVSRSYSLKNDTVNTRYHTVLKVVFICHMYVVVSPKHEIAQILLSNYTNRYVNSLVSIERAGRM
jgi:hypothetical protein